MSFRQCIINAEAEGTITPEQAARAREIFDDEFEQIRADLGDDAAADAAGRAAFDRLDAEAVKNRQQVRLQQAAARRIRAQTKNGTDFNAIADLIEHFGARTWSSVTSRWKAIRGRAHARMARAILHFERDNVGRTRNKADLRNMVREAFGQDTGDASARALARSWSDSAEFLRKRFNAAGGAIASRSDWGLPQKHDSQAVRAVGLNDWLDYVRPRLDRARMVDELTGRPITDAALHKRLVEAYHAITTEGWSRRDASSVRGNGRLANTRADHRFMVFRDPDAWMEYQERFGHADPFAAMMEHIDSLSRDIASMEILGPNPNATVRYLESLVERAAVLDDAQTGGRSIDRARGRIKVMRDMWAMHSGSANAPVDGRLARWVGTAASLKVAAQLGSAMISAISDTGFTRIARRMVGMNSAVPLQRVLKLMMPGEGVDKLAAVRLGLIADGAANLGLAQARYAGEFVGHEWARQLADLTLRWSLLSPWTQAGRWSFGMEFMGFMADNAGRTFKDLPDELQQTLGRYGIDAGQWEAIRSTPMYEPKPGATFLRPDDIADRTDLDPDAANSLADRVLEMVMTETEYAVPTASLRGRSFLVSQNQPGTFVGTLLRSFSMYKSFPSTVMILFTGRGAAVAAQAGSVAAGRYAAKVLITTTVLGALALQLKEISKGRDPRPMTSPEFWGAAMLQGGGLGIFGDFLGQDVNRFGGGLATTVGGPLTQLADDVRRLTVGNLMEIGQQEDTNAAGEALRFIKGNTPGGSIWYLRLAYERLILDEVEEFIDPDARGRQRRLERRYDRDYGQGYWWAPGDMTPERAPDLGNALAEAPAN